MTRLSLQDLFRHFFRIYGRRNRMFLPSLRDRIDFLNFAIGDLQEAVRKNGNAATLKIALARIAARIFCVAEHFSCLPFVAAIARKYPFEGCAYCKSLPCNCPERRPQPEISPIPLEEQLRWSLAEWCDHFRLLYGERNHERGIENLLNRLFKEVAELLSVSMCVADRKSCTLDEIEESYAFELADTLAWTIAIANYFGIDFEGAVMERYGKGCSTCGRESCVCTSFNMEPVKWLHEEVNP